MVKNVRFCRSRLCGDRERTGVGTGPRGRVEGRPRILPVQSFRHKSRACRGESLEVSDQRRMSSPRDFFSVRSLFDTSVPTGRTGHLSTSPGSRVVVLYRVFRVGSKQETPVVGRVKRPLTETNRDFRDGGPFGESRSFDSLDQWGVEYQYTSVVFLLRICQPGDVFSNPRTDSLYS